MVNRKTGAAFCRRKQSRDIADRPVSSLTFIEYKDFYRDTYPLTVVDHMFRPMRDSIPESQHEIGVFYNRNVSLERCRTSILIVFREKFSQLDPIF